MMMKKRLLALALCLVMVSSLLPITAAAYTREEKLRWVHGITDNGTYCKEASFTINCPEGYNVSSVEVDKDGNGAFDLIISPVGNQYKISGHLGPINVVIHLQDADSSSVSVDLFITIHDDHTDNNADHKCDNCGESAHTWQFKAAGNTLTGTCGGANCDIREIVLTLKADSVTLPNSPFNARLEGWEEFQTATGAEGGNIVYRYKGSGDETFGNPIDPIAANAKAGQYQAWVMIKSLPGPVVGNEIAALAEDSNIKSTAELFVHYTAADPAITAQTGDDRPIEIMLVSALAFSVLAAAAFLVDSKRKYRQS